MIVIGLIALAVVVGSIVGSYMIWKALPSTQVVAAAKDVNTKAAALLDACERNMSNECATRGYIDNLRQECRSAAENIREYLTYCDDPRLLTAQSEQPTTTAPVSNQNLGILNANINDKIISCTNNWDSSYCEGFVSTAFSDCGQLSPAERHIVTSCDDSRLDGLRQQAIQNQRFRVQYDIDKTNKYIVETSSYISDLCSKASPEDCMQEKANIWKDCFSEDVNPYYINCGREYVLGMHEWARKADVAIDSRVDICTGLLISAPHFYSGNLCDWDISERIPKLCQQISNAGETMSACNDRRIEQYLAARNLKST